VCASLRGRGRVVKGGLYVLPKAIAAFRARYPGVEVALWIAVPSGSY
jgi:DNA-binding transcriptional LysR family regulator